MGSTSTAGQQATREALAALADATGVANERVAIDVDADPVWRGPFPIDAVAVACVATATAAVAELGAVRNGTEPAAVAVDARHAAACFAAEGLVEPQGWTIPPVWDPVAGDYPTADGWIRLHTNYAHHRRAALRALGVDDGPSLTQTDLAPTVAGWTGEDLEAAVVAAGGVAGRQRSIDEWRRHPSGVAVGAEPLLDLQTIDAAADPLPPATRPLDGVRVLDLTRVLAGPTATSVLAAWGADVVRIDPPGFVEVPAIVPITTAGKRTASLDLRTAADRERLLGLLADADVVVHGYRRDVLQALGVGPASWMEVRPGLVDVSLDAYGWTGPWADRRGFDSIVQHSVGITSVGRHALGADHPVPLPCQALDHGCGWLLAAAAAAGLTQRCRHGHGGRWRTSLARFSALVVDLPRSPALDVAPPSLDRLAPFVVTAPTAWGPLRRLAWPGHIDGQAPVMGRSGPLGAGTAGWEEHATRIGRVTSAAGSPPPPGARAARGGRTSG